MSVIRVEGLRKTYGGRPVVDGVSFEVAEGEIFGLVGPNGAGKTTTVECAEGLRRPDEGTVRLLGLDPWRERAEVRRLVGVQLQQARLQDNLRVREALQLYAAFYERPRDVDGLLAEWGLADKAATRFRRLSGGQQQRLFIALALVGDPRVVFLDELTTGLDPTARHATWELVRGIRDRGVTIVLVSHFMDEVATLCDRAAVLHGGRIVASGTPAELIAAAGAETTVAFRPTAPLDVHALAGLPGVTRVDQADGRITVRGSGAVADAVTGHLARHRVVVTGLRIGEGSLDQAYRSLTGNGPGVTGDPPLIGPALAGDPPPSAGTRTRAVAATPTRTRSDPGAGANTRAATGADAGAPKEDAR